MPSLGDTLPALSFIHIIAEWEPKEISISRLILCAEAAVCQRDG